MLERNDVAGGCIRTSTDLTLPGFTHEVLASWHPALHRLRCLRRARERADGARRRVRQHRPAHRNRIPGRLGGIHHRLPRGQRGGVRPARARRRCRLGAAVQRVHGQRRPRLRDPLDRALVDGRAHARPQGAPSPRPPRPARVRRQHARQLPRLGLDDVRVRGRARRSGSLGAAHGPRARAGVVRVHDAGDRRRAAARRHAGSGRRRRAPRRCAGGHRHRRGWRGAALGRRSPDPRRQRPRDRRAAHGRRGRRRRPGRSSRT